MVQLEHMNTPPSFKRSPSEFGRKASYRDAPGCTSNEYALLYSALFRGGLCVRLSDGNQILCHGSQGEVVHMFDTCAA